MFYLNRPFLIVYDRFQPGFFEELRLGEERSGTPTSKPPRFHMWCKTLQCFRPKGMVLLCSRCLDKTCQKYRNIKIPLQTIIDIIILERADLDSLILWCVCIIVTMVWTFNMTAELCWERNFNLMHGLIHHIVFWVVFTELLLVCHWHYIFFIHQILLSFWICNITPAIFKFKLEITVSRQILKQFKKNCFSSYKFLFI